MDKYGYTIKPKKEEKPAELYRKPDLALKIGRAHV